ncbi:hypothetical protein CONPUDRAFT_167215 [Coniophora puteana RWD-64-598 SS2]|uniref:F-box domain-containing protein n=1 Tax=Coniophora puteana (strain RWD-64-598) TaxID=741705 RepID=A0A5M3MG00_CONPW|nr:uncharacterized protein CONPUDRAFT_167215 [Coniophora puteana RWD-64-598 SS2]EIW78142.1 hypothetical protein CONPUDRAFT_167215 [Coniophora puteana RWD-64-598 SS2]
MSATILPSCSPASMSGFPLVDDLIVYVFEVIFYSSTNDGRLLNTCDIARLARVCRRFREPALNVLWSFLETPAPLVLCAPEEMRMVDEKRIVRLLRPPKVSDWNIVRPYARRVKKLGYFDDAGRFCRPPPLLPTVDFAIVRELLRICTDDVFLPNLVSLNCEALSPQTLTVTEFSKIANFCSADLSRLLLIIPPGATPVNATEVLNSLQRSCPVVTVLSISAGFRYNPFDLQFRGPWLENLRVLTLMSVSLSSETIAELAVAPRLHTLKFSLTDTFNPTAFRAHLGLSRSPLRHQPSTFAYLRVLHLRALQIALLTGFFDAVSLPHLLDTTILYHDNSGPSDISPALRGLEKSCQARILRTLAFSCMAPSKRPASSPTILAGSGVLTTAGAQLADTLPDISPPSLVLHPILSFSTLRVLSISHPLPIIDDDFIGRLSENLGALQTLNISGPKRLSPASLVALAQNCRELRQLAMAFDGTELPAIKKRKPLTPLRAASSPSTKQGAEGECVVTPQQALKVFNVGVSIFRNATAMASFIDAIFPSTDLLYIDPCWDGVSSRMKSMRLAQQSLGGSVSGASRGAKRKFD